MPYAPIQRFGGLQGRSLAMKMVFGRLQRFAEADAPVLIEGPTGTGKEVAARALHDHSLRGDGPFEIVDCGAIPRHLMEAELFGVAQGAYTGADSSRPGIFERAAGGTVVLDEIAELPIELQPKLLGVIERGKMRRLGESHVAARSRRASWPRPTACSRARCRPAASARICTSASPCCAWRFRRCASARRTSRCSSSSSSRARRRCRRRGCGCSRSTTGRATCASCATSSSGRARSAVADGTPMLDLVEALGGSAKLPSLQSARSTFEKEYLRALLTRAGPQHPPRGRAGRADAPGPLRPALAQRAARGRTRSSERCRPSSRCIAARRSGRVTASAASCSSSRSARAAWAQVFLAEHESLGRRVAIKVLHADHRHNARMHERFAREARLAKRVRHPNVVEVTELHALPDGRPYMVDGAASKGIDVVAYVRRARPDARRSFVVAGDADRRRARRRASAPAWSIAI